MKVLAIDTTSPIASAAVVEDGRLLAVNTVVSSLSHSVTMLPMIDGCLRSLGYTVGQMDLLATAAGPGSFTGVRIGVSTLKGLAFADRIPCVGVSALEALARNLTGFSGIVVPVMNARRGQVYTAIFESSGREAPRRLTEDLLIPLNELDQRLLATAGPVWLTGDGYEVASSGLACDRLAETPELLRYQNAFYVASVAEETYRNATDDEKKSMTAAALAPIYLRKPQAEREREERLAAEGTR